jgi:prophage regulatory protein
MSSNSSTKSTEVSGFMRIKSVLKVIPVSRATWCAGVRSGLYPEAVHPSPGTSAWRTSDIEILVKQISNKQEE